MYIKKQTTLEFFYNAVKHLISWIFYFISDQVFIFQVKKKINHQLMGK